MRDTKKLAEKIAGILEAEAPMPDLASLFASIEKINYRLDKLEQSPAAVTSLRTLANPSLDKFDIAEAIADEVFTKFGKEKACTFEPNKPCDHCSMCSSRGF